MTRLDQIYGGLLGGAVGDAMGAATETRSMNQIHEYFGGFVSSMQTPPDDVFARGFPAGSVTDDFSLAYCTAKAIVEASGRVTQEVAAKALLTWSQSKFYALAGPTTRAAMDQLKGAPTENALSFLSVDNAKGSNGGAMKIAPVGLCAHGDVDLAIRNAVLICLPTHYNSAALSGACAVAAATAQALQGGATVETMIEAAIKGAEYGEAYGKHHHKELACPSIPKRIRLAVAIANKYKGNLVRVMKELSDLIGCGLAAAEAVPTAFGILAASEGDPMRAIVAGVNIGNDTDTIATMAGAMAGALTGPTDELLAFGPQMDEVNEMELHALAEAIDQLPM